MAKYKAGNYLQMSREIYQGDSPAFWRLSRSALVLREWLHECEHRFTGEEVDWFFRSNEELARDTHMSLRTIKKAKGELQKMGLIETWNFHWTDPQTKKRSHKHVTAYRILG